MLLMSLFACAGDEAPAPPPKPITAQKPSVVKTSDKGSVAVASNNSFQLSVEEVTVLKPYVDQLREGIRPATSDSIGICMGQGLECEQYLGLEAELKNPGKYMVRGGFHIPPMEPEGGWLITFNLDCTIERPNKSGGVDTDKKSRSRTSKIGRNTSEHGYRLSPLHKITSPSTRGDEKCEWSITGTNVGQEVEWKGSYSVPYKG